jgi:hypothetical protein
MVHWKDQSQLVFEELKQLAVLVKQLMLEINLE